MTEENTKSLGKSNGYWFSMAKSYRHLSNISALLKYNRGSKRQLRCRSYPPRGWLLGTYTILRLCGMKGVLFFLFWDFVLFPHSQKFEMPICLKDRSRRFTATQAFYWFSNLSVLNHCISKLNLTFTYGFSIFQFMSCSLTLMANSIILTPRHMRLFYFKHNF